ncbi:MAG: hypothetical protein HYY76_09615 [Acidobacteria bacterium]|nr:hypothetical protein [Acidobacteriota bacterium]
MRTGRMMVTIGMGVILLFTAVPVVGQEGQGAANRPAVSRPWPPARLADGQPDVQGVWAATPGGSVSLSNPISGGADLQRRITGKDIRLPSRIIDPPDGLVPYQSWAAALQQQQESVYDRPTKPEHIDPQHRCSPASPGCTPPSPRTGLFSLPARSCSSGRSITPIGTSRWTAGRVSRPT